MTDRNPPVSVVMPVFNAAATVERAVDSLLAQTLEHFELIAVDDGSDDDSAEILEAMAGLDPRIRVLRRPHGGVVAAFNAGFQASRTPYVARMDADDSCAPTRLARQLDALEATPDALAVFCQVAITRDDGGENAPGMRRYERWVNGLLTPESIALERFVECPVVNPTVLARREAFDGGYRDGDFPEDYDLWLRRLHEGERLLKLPEVLYDWTDGPNRLTWNDPRYSPAAFRRAKLTYLTLGPLAGLSEVIVWGTGPNGKWWLRDLRDAGIHVPYAIERDPRKLGQRIHGAEVIHPDVMDAYRDGQVILSAVGVEGGRQHIRAWLTERGYVEGGEFWAVC